MRGLKANLYFDATQTQRKRRLFILRRRRTVRICLNIIEKFKIIQLVRLRCVCVPSASKYELVFRATVEGHLDLCIHTRIYFTAERVRVSAYDGALFVGQYSQEENADRKLIE